MADTSPQLKSEEPATPSREATPANGAAAKQETLEPEAPTVAKTPKGKKTAAPKVPKTPKTPKTPKEPKSTSKKRPADGENGEEPTPKKMTKKHPAKINQRIAIPDNYNDLSEQDKMLVKWREDGKSWSEINTEWERLTGDKPGGSTLPNRLPRIKAAIANVAAVDHQQLLKSVVAIDNQIDAEYKAAMAKKWGRVAEHMKDNGASQEYQAALLEKQYKKIKDTVQLEATSDTTPEAAGESDDQEKGDDAKEPESESSAVEKKEDDEDMLED